MSKKGPPKPASYEASAVFMAGVRYDYASRVLAWECGNRILSGDLNQTLPAMLPQIVLSAFAIELYFKCLIVLDSGNEPRREHALTELFVDLASDRQTSIRKWFYFTHNSVKELIDLARVYGSSDFESSLALASRIFDRWRYCYELPEDTPMALTEPILRAACETILEARPDWRPHAESLSTRPRFLDRQQ
jgi:hypothetical protein